MKFVRETSPYIRKGSSVKRMMLDVIIALLPVTVFAMIKNGWNGIYVFLIAVPTMIFFELLCNMFIKWPEGMKRKELFSKEGFKKIKDQYTINNFTAPIISGLIYSLLLPAGANPYVVFVGALFGIVVAKMLFGGLGSNIFNPAAVGRIFVACCFSLSYPDAVAGGTPLAQVHDSLTNFDYALANYPIKDLIFGGYAGAMGEVNAILILVGCIYLLIRFSADFRSMLSTILSFVIVMLTVGIIMNVKLGTNVLDFVLFQVLSGGILFGAVFMVTDPVTSPISKFGRICFGTIVGVLTAIIRLMGATPEGCAFAILMANLLVPTIDHFMMKSNGYNWKQFLGLGLSVAIMCTIVGFTMAGRI